MPPTTDVEVVERLVRIETKLDADWRVGNDHEGRLRALEARRTISPGQLWAVMASGVGLLVGVSILTRFVLEVIIR